MRTYKVYATAREKMQTVLKIAVDSINLGLCDSPVTTLLMQSNLSGTALNMTEFPLNWLVITSCFCERKAV